MNVEIGAEAALFSEKEYKNGIAVAVYDATIFKPSYDPTKIVGSFIYRFFFSMASPPVPLINYPV